jgi:hypothetical protein
MVNDLRPSDTSAIDGSQASVMQQLEDKLNVLHEQNLKLLTQLTECQTELKYERHINKLAWDFILEDKQDEYGYEWPKMQLPLAVSTPSPVSFTFSCTDLDLHVNSGGQKNIAAVLLEMTLWGCDEWRMPLSSQ